MIKISDKWKYRIDIIQWILIILLLMVCIFIFYRSNRTVTPIVNDDEYQKEQTYVKIYESQTIESLKKENRELYDSIKGLKNVESAVQIKIVYKHTTDTLYVDKFVMKEDSVYHYTYDNDTTSYSVDVKANDLKWVKADLKINDKFTIINREKDGYNQMLVEHSPNATVEKVDVYHRIEDKQKWYKNFTISPQVGVGYGLINRKPDVYVGVGVGYKF